MTLRSVAESSAANTSDVYTPSTYVASVDKMSDSSYKLSVHQIDADGNDTLLRYMVVSRDVAMQYINNNQ